MTRLPLILAAAVALSATSTLANAAPFTLVCKSELTSPDRTTTDYLRKYQVDLENRMVAFADDFNGSGYQQPFTTRIEQVSDKAIVISNAGGVFHWLDRVTGIAFSVNPKGERRRGLCSPETRQAQAPAS